eukprot:scaffold56323_cov66-Phaeocystis_antarctica.AAC.1
MQRVQARALGARPQPHLVGRPKPHRAVVAAGGDPTPVARGAQHGAWTAKGVITRYRRRWAPGRTTKRPHLPKVRSCLELSRARPEQAQQFAGALFFRGARLTALRYARRGQASARRGTLRGWVQARSGRPP